VQASEHPLVHDLVPTMPAWNGRQADVFVKEIKSRDISKQQTEKHSLDFVKQT